VLRIQATRSSYRFGDDSREFATSGLVKIRSEDHSAASVVPTKPAIQEPGSHFALGTQKMERAAGETSGSDSRREVSMSGKRNTFHPLLPVWREIPEHGSDQQEGGHVANQVTRLMSVKRSLQRHDAGVHDA
jgi:hypothetical protein